MQHQHHTEHADTGNPRRTDGAEHGDEENDQLVRQIKFDTGQTGDEKCGSGFVKGGAIHVHRCPQRHNEVGDVFLDMQMLFDTAQRDRQGRGAGTGGEGCHQRFAGAPPKMER